MAQNVRLSFSFFYSGILFYRYVLGPQGEVGGGGRCLSTYKMPYHSECNSFKVEVDFKLK